MFQCLQFFLGLLVGLVGVGYLGLVTFMSQSVYIFRGVTKMLTQVGMRGTYMGEAQLVSDSFGKWVTSYPYPMSTWPYPFDLIDFSKCYYMWEKLFWSHLFFYPSNRLIEKSWSTIEENDGQLKKKSVRFIYGRRIVRQINLYRTHWTSYLYFSTYYKGTMYGGWIWEGFNFFGPKSLYNRLPHPNLTPRFCRTPK